MVKQPKLPESDSDQILAESFNKFFIEKILKFRNSINNFASQTNVKTKEFFDVNSNHTLMTFKPTDEAKVGKITIHDPMLLQFRILFPEG